MTIDVHSHYVPREWPNLSDLCGGDDWPSLRVESEREAMIMMGDREFRRIFDNCWNADVRLADMDADGVDIQVVSPTPVFFSYERTPDQAVKVARIFNDLALEITAENRDRLLPFAQVPLQDTDAACKELERCISAGHVGVEIGNHIGDRDLDDEGVVTFLQYCASLDVPVFVHPWDLPVNRRVDRWMAQWLVSMPAETHLSIFAMIAGGAFDRLPSRLRIAFAHGGGSFPMWLGRMDNAWHHRNDVVRGKSTNPPSSYVDRFFVDSVVFEPAALELLVDSMGASQVLLGSDYPYPLGERPAGKVVTESSLPESTKRAILEDNARRFLGHS